MSKLRMIGAVFGALILASLVLASPAQADHDVEQVTAGPLQAGPNGYMGVSCPEGKTVVRGGYTWPEGQELLDVKLDEAMKPDTTYPHHTTGPNETGWYVQNGETAQTLTVWAECATEHGEPTTPPTTEPTPEPTTEPTTDPTAEPTTEPTTAPGTGGGSGDGGALPVTGVSVPAMAGVGALLLTAGGAMLLMRRRKVNFTA